MSQLMQMKSQVNTIAATAKQTAQGLAGFKSKFSQSVAQVAAIVGGSAQDVDKQMIATLQAAEKQVDEAIAALHAAASAANGYAASI